MSENRPVEYIEQNEPMESEILRAAHQFVAFTEKIRDFEITAVTLRTQEDAEEAKRLYTHHLLEAANAIEGVGLLDLTLSGEGVSVPNMTVSKIGEDGELPLGALVHVDHDEPMRKLQVAEDMSARFEGIWIDVKKSEGGFRLATSLIVQIGETNQYGMNVIPDSPVSFVTVTANRRGLVALDGTADISVDVIEMDRITQESKQLAKKYANSPYVGGAFGRYLGRLESALRSEDEKSFTALKHPRIIRALGRAGAENAAENPKATIAIQDSLLHRIGQNRQLQIVYADKQLSTNGEIETLRKYVNGRLLHVAVGGLDSAEGGVPQFVLDGVSGEMNGIPDYGVHYIPLTQVEQFSF